MEFPRTPCKQLRELLPFQIPSGEQERCYQNFCKKSAFFIFFTKSI